MQTNGRHVSGQQMLEVLERLFGKEHVIKLARDAQYRVVGYNNGEAEADIRRLRQGYNAASWILDSIRHAYESVPKN